MLENIFGVVIGVAINAIIITFCLYFAKDMWKYYK